MIRNLFNGLRRQEQITFAALCLTLVAIAFWWRIGIIAISILSIASLTKTITLRPLRPQLSTPQKICLWSMVAYGLLYVISALISANQTEGWFKAGLKAWFILLPAICLIGDTSYITKERIRALFQVFTAALLVRFAICIVISGIQFLQGAPLELVRNWEEDPIGMHHNYLALYIDITIVFLYTQILNTPHNERRRKWPSLIIAAIALLAYLTLVSSRSGIVALALAFVAALALLTFFRKQYKVAIITVSLAVVLVAGLYIAVPSIFDRFIALTTWTETYYPDDRVLAWECGAKATRGHLLFGYGSGDYMPHLVNAFEQRGYTRAIDIGYNTHNEYIETILQTGLLGLTMLLFMLFAPMVTALCKNSRNLLTVLVIIIISSLCVFEAMLNRQMGTQFIALAYCLLIISMRPSQNVAS
ncbi:MAG: O-antigen ligase family protein [Bacteroidales bacterium]|nr:O-antigen ligase family protein [Bacteroidales bacterium]